MMQPKVLEWGQGACFMTDRTHRRCQNHTVTRSCQQKELTKCHSLWKRFYWSLNYKLNSLAQDSHSIETTAFAALLPQDQGIPFLGQGHLELLCTLNGLARWELGTEEWIGNHKASLVMLEVGTSAQPALLRGWPAAFKCKGCREPTHCWVITLGTNTAC